MKAIVAAPILIVVAGIALLFAGSALANAEESAATGVGNFLSSKWVAIGLIAAGALWFASEEGYLSKV